MKLKRLLALGLALIMVFSVLPMTVGAVSCADCGHNMTVIPAKTPTYTDVGWEEYELCENCGYSTFAGFLPSLGGEPEINSFDELVFNLMLLEEMASEYSRINPGKDPIALVIKYIRTGVERYNSGSWGIMAGYEDADFAQYVKDLEAEINAEATCPEEYLTITALKNINKFNLPNGDRADIGHVFGSMDITYHNKGSINHADVSGWAGDLVDLLELSDVKGVSGDLDAMIKDVANNYLGTDHSPLAGMSQEDIEGDLDAVYIMETLYDTEYYAGALAEIFMTYYTEDLSNAQRADFFLKNRLETTGTRTQIRNAVYNAYIGNKVVATLEGTREFNTTDLTDLRKAVCYAFADYLCELAGDYVATTDNAYYDVFESASSVLAPGITQEIYRATSVDGKQMVYYVATADITRSDVHVFANYNNADPSSWAMSRVLDQANAAQEKYGNPDSPDYIKDYNVIVSTNGDGYNMSTGEPGGLLIMNGKEWHGINSSGFFGITKEGKAIIGTTAEYNSTYRGQLQDAIGGFGTILVKDGKIAVSKSSNYYDSRASRTAVGITKTGKVVLMVLDGRQEPYSCGGSMEEIAQIMFEAGCVHAVNLDGGGSTTYVAKLQGADELAVVNSPSDGAPRSVSTSLLMVSTAPSSTAFDHANLESDYNYSTIGTPVQLTPVGISATGNVTELPEGYTWAVSDTRWGSITEDGVFTGLRNGSVEVYLMLDGAVIGSKTMNIVVPQSVYFTKENMDAVYGSAVTLPIAALYEGKNVAISVSDVTLTLDNDTAGIIDGFKFTATEGSGIKLAKVTVAWKSGGETIGDTIKVNLYKQGENTFDFDKATGGDRMLAYDRVVSNATTDDNINYIAINTDEDMVTSYIFAMDMTQIPIPERLSDLIYMLPGADMENASAWNFLLQLAERISTLTEVTPVLKFDPNFVVDYSELKVKNEYFTLIGTEFDEETNTLTMRLRWIDQTAAIDPATANPLCLVTGIKLTPKEDANWGTNNRLNVVHSGKIGYEVYLRANALYSFAQKPENQEVFGLLPFVNPDDESEKGGYFGDIYKEFEDNYTLVNAKKNGWYAEDGGFTYYIEGVRMAGGVKKIQGYYYYFNDQGVNDGQTKYTGLFFNSKQGKYYFAKMGVLANGWQSIGDSWYYFDTKTNAAAVGERKIGGVIFNFEGDGKLTSGVWANAFNGWRYYYGPSHYWNGWHEIDGERYYFRNGYRLTGYQKVKMWSSPVHTCWYEFDENGVCLGELDGIYNVNGEYYYFENGQGAEKYLIRIGGDYYYTVYGGKIITNKTVTTYKSNCDLPNGTYTFGADGKMIGTSANGEIIEKDGALYYYEKGVGAEKYLICVDGDYYYAVYGGKIITNKTVTTYKSNCDLPNGTYTFGADGKMIGASANGEIIEKDGVLYYYENGKGVQKGLFKYNGDYYYSVYGGKLAVSTILDALSTSCDLKKDRYEFGADGKMLQGIVEKDGVLYYYENGKGVQKGLFKYNGDYYYSVYGGKLGVGKVIDVQSTCCDLPKGRYEFDAQGKMVQGIVEKDGVLYYYENGKGVQKGLFKYNGDYYYSVYGGKLGVGKVIDVQSTCCDLPKGRYEFDAEGKMIQGIIEKNGVPYYYENGKGVQKGLFKYNGDYYYSVYGGKIATSITLDVQSTCCDLPKGRYEFDAEGKMIGSAADGEIIEKDGVLYYYEKGKTVQKGLFKFNGDYYYSVYGGKIATSIILDAQSTNCDLPRGRYEFGADGKMLNGIIEKDGVLYYYENGKGVQKGLFKYNGDYYYSVYGGKIIVDKTVAVATTNCDLPKDTYTFDSEGKMIGAAAEGVILDINGVLYYYENGKGVQKGLFFFNGHYYYSVYGGKLAVNKKVNIVEGNGLLVETEYTFNELGQIIG